MWSRHTSPGLPASSYEAVKDTTNLFRLLCLSLCYGQANVTFSRFKGVTLKKIRSGKLEKHHAKQRLSCITSQSL